MIGTYPADTLGYLREMGMGLSAYCLDCHHSRRVLVDLIDQYGPEAVYIKRGWPLRCKCGSTRHDTRVTSGYGERRDAP